MPSIFYGKKAKLDMEPFPAGDTFDKLMTAVLAAHEHKPLATEDFKALYREMSRYTGSGS